MSIHGGIGRWMRTTSRRALLENCREAYAAKIDELTVISNNLLEITNNSARG